MQDENAEFETKIAGRVRAIARQREEFIQAQTKLAEFKDEVRCHAVHSGLPLASCVVRCRTPVLCPAVPCCALLCPAVSCCALLCCTVPCCVCCACVFLSAWVAIPRACHAACDGVHVLEVYACTHAPCPRENDLPCYHMLVIDNGCATRWRS